MRQSSSPLVVPAASSCAASVSSRANSPAYWLSSAPTIDPVSVAILTIARGLYLSATYSLASASTSRPSASALSISIVLPDIVRTTPPGRRDWSSGVAVANFLGAPRAGDVFPGRLRRGEGEAGAGGRGGARHVALHVPHAA